MAGTRKIPLTKGAFALIDEEDYEKVSEYKWHLNDSGYAVWRGYIDGKRKTIRMHRLVNNTPDDLVTDHLNHDRLDNRKCNLRSVTHRENMNNLSNPGRGYWFQKQSNHWVIDYKGLCIGGFKTEEEVIKAITHIKNGGTYAKPKRTECKYGHSLSDAYKYGKTILCKPCTKDRQKIYFQKIYIPNPREKVLVCPRGHDKTITGTLNGDCRVCARIRSRRQRYANNRGC